MWLSYVPPNLRYNSVHSVPTKYTCFVWIEQQQQSDVSPCSIINLSVLKIYTEYIYWAIRNEYLSTNEVDLDSTSTVR
jgi:restriction endonuclease S subunit